MKNQSQDKDMKVYLSNEVKIYSVSHTQKRNTFKKLILTPNY
jgi:hypothetical protein